MRPSRLFFLILLASPLASGQMLTGAARTHLIEQARARYYSPVDQGLQSFACNVNLGWQTIPESQMLPAQAAGLDQLEATTLRLSVDSDGTPHLDRSYPAGTSATARAAYDPLFDWASRIVSGFVMIWSGKGLNTPIPPASSPSTVQKMPAGYSIAYPAAGGTVQLSLNPDFTVTRIVTRRSADAIVENPTFSLSPQGLVFSAVQSSGNSGDGRVSFQGSFTYQYADEFLVLHRVHLNLSGTPLDFTLAHCSVQKAAAAAD
jgi:hypothetical protein